MSKTIDNYSQTRNPAIRESLRLYAAVGAILFLGTILTALVASVPGLDVGEHGFDKWDAMLGLGIASFKMSLVAAVFMHLNHERRLIYSVIGIASVHAIGLFIGIYWHYANMTNDVFFYQTVTPQATPETNLSGAHPPSK